MFKIKPFSILFSVFSIIICVINLSGHDVNNRILFFSSPPLWIAQAQWFKNSFGYHQEIPIFIQYIVTITFWSIIGERIDKTRKK